MSNELAVAKGISKNLEAVVPERLKRVSHRKGALDYNAEPVGGALGIFLGSSTAFAGLIVAAVNVTGGLSLFFGVPVGAVLAATIIFSGFATLMMPSDSGTSFGRLRHHRLCSIRCDDASTGKFDQNGNATYIIKKPRVRDMFNPLRLFKNVVLSKYVTRSLQNDTYTAVTHRGTWFRIIREVEEFKGDRAVFDDAVRKVKELQK